MKGDERMRQAIRMDHILIASLDKALWELMGEGALAVSSKVGEEILRIMESEMGLNFEGTKENTLDLMNDIFVKKLGLAEEIQGSFEDTFIVLNVKEAFDFDIMSKLKKENIPPFISPIISATVAVMRKKLNLPVRVKEIEIDENQKGYKLTFKVLSSFLNLLWGWGDSLNLFQGGNEVKTFWMRFLIDRIFSKHYKF